MVRFFRWLAGYVEFSFSNGFCEGFINECFENGINIYNIIYTDNGFAACCRASVYKKLHKTALRHGGKMHIVKKSGLPFFTYPLKNRAGFFIGALLFVCIFSFLGSFVWNIEIVGCRTISKSTVSAYLESNGLKTGAMYSDEKRKALAWDLMADFDNIAWAHINKIGTTARVEISEAEQKPEAPDKNKLRGVKARRITLSATVSRRQSKIQKGAKKIYPTLIFYNLKIPLYFSADTAELQTKYTRLLTVKGVELPIGFTVIERQRLLAQAHDLTDDELKKAAAKRLNEKAKRELDGYEIINKNFSFDISADSCTAVGAYIVKYIKNNPPEQ